MKTLFHLLLVIIVLNAGGCAVTQKTSAVPGKAETLVTRDGSSYERAIVVGSIREEYTWVKEHYPGSTFQQQALTFKNKKPFDVLTFKLSDGSTKDFYFDISKFYGKF